MNNNRTDRFAYSLARFFCFACALQKQGDATFNPDYTIQIMESVQSGYVLSSALAHLSE
jgi:hypothetical protein